MANGLGTPKSFGVRTARREEDGETDDLLTVVSLWFKCLATFAYESMGFSCSPSSSFFAETLLPLLSDFVAVVVAVLKNDDSSISPSAPKYAKFTNFQNQSEIIDIAVKYVTTATIAVQDETASEYSPALNSVHNVKSPRRCRCKRSFLFSSRIFVTNSSTFSFARSNLTSHL